MRIIGLCSDCVDEFLKGNLQEALIPADFVEINNAGVGIFECPNGHKSTIYPDLEKYEILFESACLAFLDGYTKESVSSFMGSLERFIEYYIKVILLSSGIEWKDIDSCWKSIAQQSERQLGAFYVLSLIDNKQELKISISPWLYKFRNDVIHKGEFPKKEKVIKFASEIRHIILPIKEDLNSLHKDGIKKHYEKTLDERYASTKGQKRLEWDIHWMLSLKYETHGLRELLSQLGKMKRGFSEISKAKSLLIKKQNDQVAELASIIFKS